MTSAYSTFHISLIASTSSPAMAIHRGIQSAIFFYLSCAPCADARYRKRRKREAAWDRAAREELAAELPGAYRHPSPSSTNPHWQTEIALGPTGVVRGKKKANASSDPRRRAPTGLSMRSESRSELDLAHNERDGDRWNYRPYQRDDEELWGSLNNLNGTTYDGSGLQMPARVRTKDSTSSTYQPNRNPPISDLHPATVTKVSSREEVMWMMQPPPVAEVMNGKERACRSRSDSGGGRLSPAMSASTVSRQVSSRLRERRIRAGEGSTTMSRESSSRTSKSAYNNQVQHTTTQLSFTSVSSRDFALSPTSSRREVDPSEESYHTVLHSQNHCTSRLQPHRNASRPQLSTITSADDLPTACLSPPNRVPTPTDLPDLVNENSIPSPPQSRDSTTTATPRKRAAQPPPILHRHSASILVRTGKELQLLQRMEVSPSPPGSQNRHSQHQPSHDEDVDDMEEDAVLTVRGSDGMMVKKTAAELFDSWYTPDFELETWVLEHTKREGVRERWSMDF
ncbi:hypothetical protein TI39_contig4210g00001 [Zymoseptoria brevis]|uniref:Uncharacterized protein n=1 Tax=Zymoseptoria brevis TaxID=1047168 RepID=A0A0F4G9X2_9PEZI|nr:hypothetical protein TI39_contig4210g00001 [Zymoseptoria brevis]